MTNLNIQTIDSFLVVDSRLVATELGIQHKNLKELIKTYQADFEGFGNLSVSNAGVVGTLGYAEFYYLNEDQCYLLLTFVKNTPEARQAKINLVKAFKGAREKVAQPQLPNDYLTALKALVAAEEEKSQLALKAAEAEAKVIEMSPKAEVYDTICESGSNLKIGEVAKLLCVDNMGPNRLFDFLRGAEVLMKSNEPYAKYEFESKYFVCIRGVKNGRNYITPLVTPKGVDFVIRLLQKNYQVVVASPSLFTGMDINQPHFDKVYLFADGAFATATDLLQASARVRTVKEVKFWVTTNKSSELTDWKQILSNKERVAFGTGWTGTVNQALVEARNGDIWAWDFDIATGIYKVKDSAYMKMFCQLQAIQNKSLNDLHSSFLEAANKEGRVVSHAVSEDEVRQSEAMKQASKVIKQQNREFKHQAIINAPVIDSDRLFILKLDPSVLSTEENNSIKRYKLLEMVGGLVEYLPEAVRHESKMFNAVRLQGWLTRSLEDLTIQDQKDLLKAPSDRRYRVKTVNLIRDFLRLVNYEGSLKGEELKAFCFEKEGYPHSSNHKWFTRNAVEFKELLGVSVPKDVEDKPFQFIQTVLKTLGLATIDKRVSVRKGDVLVNSWCGGVYPDVDVDEKIRVRNYYVDLGSVEMIAKILKAKEENFAKKEELVGLPF